MKRDRTKVIFAGPPELQPFADYSVEDLLYPFHEGVAGLDDLLATFESEDFARRVHDWIMNDKDGWESPPVPVPLLVKASSDAYMPPEWLNTPVIIAKLSDGAEREAKLWDFMEAGFPDAFVSSLDRESIAWSSDSVVAAFSAQSTQLGAIYIWEPQEERLTCVDSSAVGQACLYVPELDAFLVYLETRAYMAWDVRSLGVVFRSSSGQWTMKTQSLFELKPKPNQSPLSAEPTIQYALPTLPDGVRARLQRCHHDDSAGVLFGWDADTSRCIIAFGGSGHAVPVRRRSSEICIG